MLDIQKRTEEVLKEQESLERVEAARRFEKGCTVWLFLPVEEREAPWVECLVDEITNHTADGCRCKLKMFDGEGNELGTREEELKYCNREERVKGGWCWEMWSSSSLI